MKYLIFIMGFVICDLKNLKFDGLMCFEYLYFDEGWKNIYL